MRDHSARLELGRHVVEWHKSYQKDNCTGLFNSFRWGRISTSAYRNRLWTHCVLRQPEITGCCVSRIDSGICHLGSISHQGVTLALVSTTTGEVRVSDLQSNPDSLLNQRRGCQAHPQSGEVWRDDDPRLLPARRCVHPSFTLKHRSAVAATVGVPNHSNMVVSGTNGRQIHVWDLTKPDEPLQLGSTMGPVRGLAMAGPAVVYAALQSQRVACVDLRTPFHEQTVLCCPLDRKQRHSGDILSIALPPTRIASIVTGGRDSKVKLWDVRGAGNYVQDFERPGHHSAVRALTLFDNGEQLLSRGGVFDDTDVWRISNGERQVVYFQEENRPHGLPNVTQWNLETMTTQVALMPRWAGPPGCDLIWMAGDGGSVHLVELVSGRLCCTLDQHVGMTMRQERSPDGLPGIRYSKNYDSMRIKVHWVETLGWLLVSGGDGDVLIYENVEGARYEDNVKYMHV